MQCVLGRERYLVLGKQVEDDHGEGGDEGATDVYPGDSRVFGRHPISNP